MIVVDMKAGPASRLLAEGSAEYRSNCTPNPFTPRYEACLCVGGMIRATLSVEYSYDGPPDGNSWEPWRVVATLVSRLAVPLPFRPAIPGTLAVLPRSIVETIANLGLLSPTK